MSKYKVLQLSLPCKRWMLLKCKFDSPYFHLQELRTFNQLRWTEINRSMCPWPNAKQWKLRDATWLAMLREDFLSRLLPSSCKSFCKNSKSGLVSVASIFSTCTCSIWAAKSLRWEFLTGLKVKQTFRLTLLKIIKIIEKKNCFSIDLIPQLPQTCWAKLLRITSGGRSTSSGTAWEAPILDHSKLSTLLGSQSQNVHRKHTGNSGRASNIQGNWLTLQEYPVSAILLVGSRKYCL